jgi:predicted transcriptional regulator
MPAISHATAAALLYILKYMKQLLIELEDDDAERLERVAPSRSRRRSEFIRAAIRRALWDIEEQATAEAYRRHPDSAADVYVDVRAWETPPKAARRRRR